MPAFSGRNTQVSGETLDNGIATCYFNSVHTRKEEFTIQNQPPRIPLAECHCLNLRRITLQTIEQYDQHVRPAGINIQQFALLRHLRLLAPLSITELAEATWLDRTTLSRNLKVLGKKGLVQDSTQHGRRRQLELTQEGQRVLTQAEALWQEAQRAFADKLGPERLAQWKDILQLLLGSPEEQ